MTFKNGNEMLKKIQSCVDLYNPEKNAYVFLYNDAGSICVYGILPSETKHLVAFSKESGEYWGACLGTGGHIYDDPSYEFYNSYSISNLEWCEDNFDGEWYDTKEWEVAA